MTKLWRVNLEIGARDRIDGGLFAYPVHVGFAADKASAHSFAACLDTERLAREFRQPRRDVRRYELTGAHKVAVAEVS